MNKVVLSLAGKLSGGSVNNDQHEFSHGFVETVARAYETARNALEYRAENLVRRAAIERILKRLLLIYKDPNEIAENLITELKWARYLDRQQSGSTKKKDLVQIIAKYLSFKGSITGEWIIKIASAEIEELFNLNKDYFLFTLFAFQVINQKIKLSVENQDLLVFYAVDKVFAVSDPEQIAYHIIGLSGKNIDSQKMEAGWKLFKEAGSDPNLPRITKFVRRNMPPIVLLRDMYFYSPGDFISLLNDEEKFLVRASEVLENQLKLMSGKISTAGIRSIIYVFLTKMVLAFGLEVPLEILIYRHTTFIPLAINLIFPPILMWFTTMQIKVPSQKERDLLTRRTWYVVNNFDELKSEDDELTDKEPEKKSGLLYWVFSTLYVLIFIAVFWIIYYLLGVMGFKFFNKFIFIFFLTIIAFFAYRIKQIAQVYIWKPKENTSSISDMVSLPILTIGSYLSQGLSRLNFLGFLFDFILEAPFKLILGFIDDWVQFLSAKKEQQILD